VLHGQVVTGFGLAGHGIAFYAGCRWYVRDDGRDGNAYKRLRLVMAVDIGRRPAIAGGFLPYALIERGASVCNALSIPITPPRGRFASSYLRETTGSVVMADPNRLAATLVARRASSDPRCEQNPSDVSVAGKAVQR
jgi:hypothetical protein